MAYYTADSLGYNDDSEGLEDLNSVLEASSILAKDITITEALESYSDTFYDSNNTGRAY